MFSFITQYFSAPTLGDNMMNKFETEYFGGLFKLESTVAEKIWLDVGFNKFVTVSVHWKLATWVTSYALDKDLAAVVTTDDVRRFRLKHHAMGAIRDAFVKEKPEWSHVYNDHRLVFENSLVYGLQQTMESLHLIVACQSHGTTIGTMGNANALPHSRMRKRGL